MNKQINFIEEETNVEKYEFKKPNPIQGYPELYWRGKRPFTSTQYYPAQLKERYGEEKDGWMNKIFWGDNLQVMSHMLKEYRGKVNLIYIDPPFDSKADYKKKIKLKGKKEVSNDMNSFEEKQYTDIWTNDEYLQFMYERLIIIKELLHEDGSIYLHCDWHKVHQLRCIMDEVFGPDKFMGEITWKRTGGHHLSERSFDVMTDTILFYGKSSNITFNPQYEPLSEEELNDKFPYIEEETGRRFNHEKLEQSSNAYSAGEKRIIQGKEVVSNIGWRWSQDTFDERLKENPYLIYWTQTGRPRYKNYADQYQGRKVGNLWVDIQALTSNSGERLDYPTQKPEALLERIISTSSNPGDLVFDCFMGSGTTQATAIKLKRRFIGSDINLGSVQTTTKRLINIIDSCRENEDVYSGLEIYNVNNYDFFRNELEAKDILIEALEIQKLEANSVYDGEKDGRMVKIMHVNKIATRADLNQLIANLPYKIFEERKSKNPRIPVEKITLVCMGHEADLAAYLKNEVAFNIDVEVLDILRDKSNLEFKRDSEAEIVIDNDKLIIENFYPMNLLQKLSLMKENVQDWKELVESIMIDFNYDGVVMEPTITDVPDKKDLVIGEYKIPSDAGRIKVKITDVLSETFEWEGDYE